MMTAIAIERHTDAERLNEVANHPSVYPWVKGRTIGRLDLSEPVANPANVLLMGEHGGMFFMHLQPGLYEAHILVLPGGRGEWAERLVHSCLHWMFCRTDAVEIMARCPRGNVAVKALARGTGWNYEFAANNAWVANGRPVSADIYAMRIQDWIRQSPILLKRGAWFRRDLVKKIAMYGDIGFEDGPDEFQDRHIGMAYDMLCGGQPEKAVLFYNRAALLSDYLPFTVVSLAPTTINIGGALIIVRQDDFWIATICEEAA